MSDEKTIKRKQLGTVKCPACGVLIEVIEKETIIQPFQKKVSEKELEAEKCVQTTFEEEVEDK